MKSPFKTMELQDRRSAGLGSELAVALLSGAIFVLAHFRALINPFILNDDARQQIYWMQQWQDPGLFRGDFLTDYARHYVTWGVKGLYWLASWGVPPLYFSKLLPGLLFIFLAVCLFRIGTSLSDRRLAWMMVAVFWLMPFFLDNLAGGLARAFAAPLLALFWLGWLEKRPWVMAAALLLQALFIPYIFMVAALAAMLAWLLARFGQDNPPPFPAKLAHIFLLALGAVLVLGMNLQFSAAGYGPLVSVREMVNQPEFYAHGRYAILPEPSLLWELISPMEFIPLFREWGPMAGALSCVVLLVLVVAGARQPGWAPWLRLKSAGYLALASLLVYFLARLLLLKLFVPDRYLMYTLNLFYCLFLALGLQAALRVTRWPRQLAILALVVAAGLGAWRLEGVGLKDYSAYRTLYAALAATNKDVLIAGHPNLMDTVPTFARRRAFATYELAQPWSRNYWAKLKPRLHDLFQAYYAADPQEVIAFCRKYGIAFLIVDDRHFTPAFLKGGYFLFPGDQPHVPGVSPGLAERLYCPFFAPFDDQIRHVTAGRNNFALLSDQGFHTLTVDQHVRLVDMRPWLTPKP
ncbi:MAG: hypothetical protein M0P73_16720 [Syntrophobacterales bacterium]|nr:hypothetical protein [Syntrophobacterales bacterium]